MTAIIRTEKLSKSYGNAPYFDELPISPEVVAQVVSGEPGVEPALLRQREV